MFKIGIVGYCPPTKFDQVEAWDLVKTGLMRAWSDAITQQRMDSGIPDGIPLEMETMVVGGLSANGCIHETGYWIARQLGWSCGGIASEKVKIYKWWPMSEEGDMLKIFGKKWGDESKTFIEEIDALVRVGGGAQSQREVKLAKNKGIPVYEYELEAE